MIGLMLMACFAGVLTKLVSHLPYTIALTLVGLGIGLTGWGPDPAEIGFGHDFVFFVILPPLLFQGSLHLQLGRLLQHFWPILCYASVGVLISMLFIGAIMFWIGGVDHVLVALLFGAMLSPTDPVSVLAIFKDMKVPKDLKYLVEGESLFNDGTGVVIFTIVLGLILSGEEFHAAAAATTFIQVTVGGLGMGVILGAAAFALLRPIDDKLLENAICVVLAYGAFWMAESFHVSGVIATVVAGLLIGNYGRRFSMSRQTAATIETFFESIDFLLNSILFVLIGLELQTIDRQELVNNVRPLLAGIAALLISRAVAVYPLHWMLNRRGTRRPAAYAHVMWWGGLRGSIPIALMLHLPVGVSAGLDAWRPTLLIACFGAVFFSLVIQGMTMKPLLLWLDLKPKEGGSAP